MKFAYLVLLSCAAISCGRMPGKATDDDKSKSDEAGEAAPQEHRSMLVASNDKLPECSESAEGWLVYVKKTEQFKACTGGAWEVVSPGGSKSVISKDDEERATRIKLVFDDAGLDVGYLTEDEKSVILKTGGLKINLASLKGGFSDKQSDYQQCLYIHADCSSECFLGLSTKAFFTDNSNIKIPSSAGLRKVTMKDSKDMVPGSMLMKTFKAKKGTAGVCEATTSNEPGFDEDIIFQKAIDLKVKLPLKIVEL